MTASPETIYRAYINVRAVATWLPPGSMHGIVREFDPREDGAFSISLIYSDSGTEMRGKSAKRTDTFRGTFARLVPNREITWLTVFDSPDPAFTGEMTVRTDLSPVEGGTHVTIACEDIPPGIRLEDNQEGYRQTLETLAAYVIGQLRQ